MDIKFKILFLLTCCLSLGADTYYYSFGKKVELTPLPTQRSLTESDVRWYTTPAGMKLGVKNEVIIGCEDFDHCCQNFKSYPIARMEKLSDTLYLLHLKEGADPFEVANALHALPCITLSHPNFIKKRQLR